MYKTAVMYFNLTNYIFLGLYLIEVVVCAPATDGPWEDDVPEETSFLEADIVLDSEVISLKDLVTNGERNLVADPRRLWPNRTLVYELQGEVPAPLRARVHTALTLLSQHSCVRFQPRRRQRPYLRVRFTGKGCFSKVGYPQQGGAPSLQVGSSSCWTLGTIQHELLHALGFWHEHARPDRDQFITVLWDNIRPGRKKDFTKRSYHDATNLGLPYDYASVMHYKPTAFGKVRGSSTLVSKKKDGTKFMGQRRGVTKVDIAKLNRLYNCNRGYYRGDDLEGVGEVIGEVLEPTGRGNEEEQKSESSKQRHEKKERRGKLLKKGEKSIRKHSTLIKYVMYNAFSRQTGMSTANEYLENDKNNEDAKHNRVKRQTGQPKSREGKTVPEGEHQESFAPQKILPELLKGVLSNDNNERPIVIQFAIYQPIVYKSGNESENADGNKSKQTNEQDALYQSRDKNEGKFGSNHRNKESGTGYVDVRRPNVGETHVEGENNKPPSRYYETSDEYYTQNTKYHRPSTAVIEHNEHHYATSKDIQPLNVHQRRGEDGRTKDRPDQHDYNVRDDRYRDHREEYKPHEPNVRYDHVTEESYVDSKHASENKDHFDGPKKEYHPTYKPYTHEIEIEDTMTDNREYLRIPTSRKEDETYDPRNASNQTIYSISVDEAPHSHFSEDHAISISYFEEPKPQRKNNDDNFKLENVSPFWNSGMSEDDNVKQFKQSEVHEDPLSLLRDHVGDSNTWKSDSGDKEVIEIRVVENNNRPKIKHDLEIKEDHTEELDRDIRRRKLEQERLKESTTRKPVIPGVTIGQSSSRIRDSEVDSKKTQGNSKGKVLGPPPKRSQASTGVEDRREELGSDSEGLISKPNSAKLNLSPQQALPLKAPALKSSSTARTAISKVLPMASKQ